MSMPPTPPPVEAEGVESAYRRQIVRLTKERDEARRERDEARAQWKQEVRALQAQLREGTSAQVAALRIELARLRARTGKRVA